jgi:hypothetical protein
MNFDSWWIVAICTCTGMPQRRSVFSIARKYCGRSRMIAQASSNCLGAE